MSRPAVQSFFHKQSSTWSHVVHDGQAAAIVDPVLDFDMKSGVASPAAAGQLVAFLHRRGLTVEWILETHAHADHLTSAPWLKQQVGGRVAIGEGIRKVQATFRELLNLEPGFPTDGRQFDRLLEDGETLRIGTLEARAIATPGHTGDGMSYLIGDALFVGDTLFMPDGGTARCDFPGGDARALYASIRRLYGLPGETRVFVCHDYGPGGREVRCETTIADEARSNIHLQAGTSEEDFVKLRTRRDATLDAPALLYPSIQVNIRGGTFPPAEANGRCYLKLPIRESAPEREGGAA